MPKVRAIGKSFTKPVFYSDDSFVTNKDGTSQNEYLVIWSI